MSMRVLFLALLLAVCAFAADVAGRDSAAVADSATVDSPAVDTVSSTDSVAADSAIPERHSVPLPRLSAYTGKGLMVGLAFGLYNPTEDCDCLGVWQGQGEYFYSDWISAGFDGRFFGGNLDKDKSVLYQRYRINTRFHFPQGEWSWYVGPIIGFESTNLEDIRDEWHQRENEWGMPIFGTMEEEEEIEDCEKMFSLDGFSVGVDVGGGAVFLGVIGATASILYEYNFGGAQLLTISPGIAYNLQAVWPWAARHLSATWLSVETGFQRFFNRSVDSWALSGYLGVAVGF